MSHTYSESWGRALSHGPILDRSYHIKILSNSRFSFSCFPVFLGFQHRAPDVACLKHWSWPIERLHCIHCILCIQALHHHHHQKIGVCLIARAVMQDLWPDWWQCWQWWIKERQHSDEFLDMFFNFLNVCSVTSKFAIQRSFQLRGVEVSHQSQTKVVSKEESCTWNCQELHMKHIIIWNC